MKGLGALEAVENKNLHIVREPDCWECGDGCCTEWFEKIYLNGEYLGDAMGYSPYDILELVLEHLGYTITIE